jgi:hypothetical protein
MYCIDFSFIVFYFLLFALLSWIREIISHLIFLSVCDDMREVTQFLPTHTRTHAHNSWPTRWSAHHSYITNIDTSYCKLNEHFMHVNSKHLFTINLISFFYLIRSRNWLWIIWIWSISFMYVLSFYEQSFDLLIDRFKICKNTHVYNG